MNQKIFYFLHSFAHQSSFNDGLIIFLADILPYIVIVFAIFFVLLHHDIARSKNPFSLLKQKAQEISFVFLTSISAWVMAYVFKNIFMAPRPFLGLPNVAPLWIEGGYAFPSGHATAFMALALAIFLCHKKVGYVFIGFAILIGVARIMAGVHFPVDILAGFILGGGMAYLIKHSYLKEAN
jgi:undecaprenyl-diphosphatase